MAHFVLNSLENDPNIHRNFKLTVIFDKITAKCVYAGVVQRLLSKCIMRPNTKTMAVCKIWQ